MSTFSTELMTEMERLHAAAKARTAQLEVQVVELEAQNAQLLLEAEALQQRADLEHSLGNGFSVAMMTAEKQLEVEVEVGSRLRDQLEELREAAEAYRRDERYYAQLDAILDKVKP